MTKLSKVAVARPSRVDCCHRCGGLMVSEQVHELASFEWRCVSCGERIDPVILAHRREGSARHENESAYVSRGSLHLS